MAAGKKVDLDLFNGLIGVLEELKSASNPRVLLFFRATQDPEPVTDEEKLRQKLLIYLYCEKNPEIKNLAENDPNHNPILPVGDTFSPEQIRRRERVIVERLKEALTKILDSDLFELTPTETGTPADRPGPRMEIAYHTHCTGEVYLYTSTEQRAGHAGGYRGGKSSKTKWLLHRSQGLHNQTLRTRRNPKGAGALGAGLDEGRTDRQRFVGSLVRCASL